MDIPKLNAIAEEMRRFEARRLGMAPQVLGAIGQAPPPLPRPPAWFEVLDGGLAVSPDCSSQLVVAAIRKATRSLDLYIYNIAASYLLAELAAAKARGVAIRIMYDARDDGVAEKAALQALGVVFIAAPSTAPARRFSFCHQKFAIADRRYLLLHSANWMDSAIPQRVPGAKYRMGNREWLTWVESGPLADWFLQLFELDWSISKQALSTAAAASAVQPMSSGSLAFSAVPTKQFDPGSITEPCRVFPLISPNNYQDLIPHLNAATSSICIQQQYIIAGKGVMELLEALARQNAAGIPIRILVSPKFPDYWQRSLDTLKAAGIGHCLRSSNLKYVVHCHNKGVLIDDRYSVVSSTNWSESSVTQGREAGLLVDSKQVARYFQEAFDFDWRVGIDPGELASRFALVGPGDEH